MNQHQRDIMRVTGEGVISMDANGKPVTTLPTSRDADHPRFVRLGHRGEVLDEPTRAALARAMASAPSVDSNPGIPAGFTYVAQFSDHDMTFDSSTVPFGTHEPLAESVEARSAALDLDLLYGKGPSDPDDGRFYESDGVRLKTGKTSAVPEDPATDRTLAGFDLPRVVAGPTKQAQRAAHIPDLRNDQNLVLSQTHAAFIRFHNKLADHLVQRGSPSGDARFERVRDEVIRHYHWMLHTDFLPRVISPEIVDDVFTHGRRFLAPGPTPGRERQAPSSDMPLEYSVGAGRFGHSMVRDVYEWNRIFNTKSASGGGTLERMFRFTALSGNLSPKGALDAPDSGMFLTLPTNWVIDWRRFHDFGAAGRPDLVIGVQDSTRFNVAKRIDPHLVEPLGKLPLGTFGGRGTDASRIEHNLAFRDLTRAFMLNLASGQQTAELLGAEPIGREELIAGIGSEHLAHLTEAQRETLARHTPLLYYVMREAQLNQGRLGTVGGRLVAEVYHRGMELTKRSFLHQPVWRPTLGPDANTFRMADLLLFAFDGRADLLNPVG